MELEIIEKNIIELEFVDVEKYNPYHDRLGRFTSPGGAASFSIGNRSGLAWNQKNVDRAIAREKYRTRVKGETQNKYGGSEKTVMAATAKKGKFDVQLRGEKPGTFRTEKVDGYIDEEHGIGYHKGEGARGYKGWLATDLDSGVLIVPDAQLNRGSAQELAAKRYKELQSMRTGKSYNELVERFDGLKNEAKSNTKANSGTSAKETKNAKTTKQPKTYADVKSKQDFVDYVEHRHNVKLSNDKGYTLNRKRDVLYTNIPKAKQHEVLNDFKKHGIRYEEHMNDNYFVYFKNSGAKNSGSTTKYEPGYSVDGEYLPF